MTHLARVIEVTGYVYSRCLRTFSCGIVRTDISCRIYRSAFGWRGVNISSGGSSRRPCSRRLKSLCSEVLQVNAIGKP
eukprot:COSAG01_NODE_65_length_29252_cov_173.296995_2_plen_78_part_00